ncbi:chromosome partitioning protein ParA [Vibrio nomapromontoriensis]|uniref:chromosome partitioning protein ParA n=1 Tax=Vibrio nomapromontoriensis TaxID=2910246 RepID=UPI003D13ABA1
MKRFSLIIVSVVLAGTALLSINLFSIKKQQSENQVVTPIIEDDPPRPDYDSPVFSTIGGTKGMKLPVHKTSATMPTLAEQLNTLKGRALVREIDVFWRTCMSEQNCDNLLSELETYLSHDRYELVKNFQQLNNQWQQSIGNLLFDKQQTLASRIAQFKADAHRIWGPLANVILEDEFALYDFSLQAEQLNNEPIQNYLASFEELLQTWQGKEETLGLDSNQAKFERAVALIPGAIDEAERQAIINELKQTYLTPAESDAIDTRQQQVKQQQSLVRDYQSELQQLESELSQQRATIYANLSALQWQHHHQQQIANFRREFFTN